MATEYLGQQALTRVVTPGRVAYLVTEGDGAGFERAVTLASGRWAGVTEPIVGIGPSNELSGLDSQVVQTADVSCLISVGVDVVVAQTLASALGLQFRTVDDYACGNVPYAVRNEGWALPQERVPTAAHVGGELWEKVAAGVRVEVDEVRTVFRSSDHIGRAQFGNTTLFDSNLCGFGEAWSSSGPGGPVTVWVTDGSLEDVWAYWNVRTLRPLVLGDAPTFLVPLDGFGAWIDLWTQVDGRLARRRFAGKPHIGLFSTTVGTDALRALGEGHGFEEFTETTIHSQFNYADTDAGEGPPYLCSYDIDPINWLVGDRRYGYVARSHIQAFRAGTQVPLAVESLDSQNVIQPTKPMILRLHSPAINDLPRTPSVARAVEGNAVWNRDDLEVTVGYYSSNTLGINLPSNTEVLDAMVRDVPATATLGDKGVLTAALLEARDCSVLMDSTVLTAIRGLTTPRAKHITNRLDELNVQGEQRTALEELLATYATPTTRHYASVRSLNIAGLKIEEAHQALEALANSGWAQRGFATECARCKVPVFLELRDVPDVLACPGCGSANVTIAGDSKQSYVQYRLETFIDRCADQGVVTHAAVATALGEMNEFSAFHMGMELAADDSDSTGPEVDLFGFVGRQILCGEVKTSASEFTQAQIDRDVAISVRLGATTHVVGCAERLPTVTAKYAREKCDAVDLGLYVVGPGPSSSKLFVDALKVSPVSYDRFF